MSITGEKDGPPVKVTSSLETTSFSRPLMSLLSKESLCFSSLEALAPVFFSLSLFLSMYISLRMTS